MTTATVSSRGQVTIPSDVRRALSVGARDRVEFIFLDPGKFAIVAAKRPVTELKGLFGKSLKPMTIEQMDAAIANSGAKAR